MSLFLAVRPSMTLRLLWQWRALLALTVLALACHKAGPARLTLRPGLSLSSRVEAGTIRSFAFELRRDQYLALRVTQEPVDVVLTFYCPDAGRGSWKGRTAGRTRQPSCATASRFPEMPRRRELGPEPPRCSPRRCPLLEKVPGPTPRTAKLSTNGSNLDSPPGKRRWSIILHW